MKKVNKTKKLYQTISGCVMNEKNALEYYGSQAAFENALKANILFKFIFDSEMEVVGEWV